MVHYVPCGISIRDSRLTVKQKIYGVLVFVRIGLIHCICEEALPSSDQCPSKTSRYFFSTKSGMSLCLTGRKTRMITGKIILMYGHG